MNIENSKSSDGRRAMVGDWSAVDGQLLQILLTPLFNDILCEQDGQSILAAVSEAIRNHSVFDVVILNRKLRKIDGIETARQLRTAGYAGPIIGTTIELNQQLKAKWTQAGANAFITKPISKAKLFSAIEESASIA